jgi:hypothetical protein
MASGKNEKLVGRESSSGKHLKVGLAKADGQRQTETAKKSSKKGK